MATSSLSSRPVVFVIGASGKVGSSTLKALAANYADQVEIRAGVRNFDKVKDMDARVSYCQATMGDREGLKDTLKGVDSLFIVTPSAENCDQLVISTAEIAKEVGIKHLMTVGHYITLVENFGDTILGAPYVAAEEGVAKLGVPFTILRLPEFVDELWSHKVSIASRGVISSVFTPERVTPSVVVEDIGKAAAAILVDPSKHAGKTYCLVSDCYSYNDVVKVFSEVLGKHIEFHQLSIEEMERMMSSMKLPQRTSNGLLEMVKLSRDCSRPRNPAETLVTPDYEMITGEKPTTLKAWIEKNAVGFMYV